MYLTLNTLMFIFLSAIIFWLWAKRDEEEEKNGSPMKIFRQMIIQLIRKKRISNKLWPKYHFTSSVFKTNFVFFSFGFYIQIIPVCFCCKNSATLLISTFRRIMDDHILCKYSSSLVFCHREFVCERQREKKKGVCVRESYYHFPFLSSNFFLHSVMPRLHKL